MKLIKHFLLSLTLVILPITCVVASDLVVEEGVGEYRVGIHAWYFFARPGEVVTPAQLMESETMQRLLPLNREVANFGFESRALWLKIGLTNSGPRLQNRLFVPGWLSISITAYQYFPNTGKMTQLPLKPLQKRLAGFELSLPPHSHSLLLVQAQVQPDDVLLLRLRLFDPEAYAVNDTQLQGLSGLYYGALLIMTLYNLFLFFSLRDRAYLYYVFLLVSSMFYFAANDGLGIQYLWPLESNIFVAYVSGFSFGIGGMLFVKSLLDMKKNAPRWERVLNITIMLTLSLIAAFVFFPLRYTVDVANVFALFLLFVVYFSGIKVALSRSRTAIIFSIGWSIYLITLISNNLVALGIPPWDIGFIEMTFLMKIGSVIEITIFSLALADRINLMRKEQLARKTRDAADLEKIVEERTAELTESNHTKDKFFSIISHDLQGPIGSLAVMYNEVLKSPADLDQEIFVATQQTTKNASQLLSDLLAWSRSQTNQLEPVPTLFEVQLPIQEMTDFLQAQAQRKHIEIQIDVERELFCFADQAMITTVIRNLLSNAIKFTPEGGKIVIEAFARGSEIYIGVQDTGQGMHPEMLAKLFKLGEKITSSLGTSKEKGTGLGLILCKEFVEKNGGKIEVESEWGKGSRFWFYLRKVDAQEQSLSLDMSRLTALIVDDDALHQKSTANALSGLRMSFDLASNGQEAVQKAKATKYDFVLMDIDMPVMDGIEATRLIQQQVESLPMIIALSAYGEKELEDRLAGVAFAAYLQKPLLKQKLTEALRNHFA